MTAVAMVNNPADGTANPGGHYHGAEMDNVVKAAGGFGVLLEAYSMTVLENDRVVTIPAFDAVVPDGSGGFKVVSKSSATNITITAAASTPRTDHIGMDSGGTISVTDGVATAETGDVEEAPMTALAADEIMLCKVRAVADQTNVLAADVVGRAIDISRHGFTLHKVTTETISTDDTLSDDDTFTFPVAVNGIYVVEAHIIINSGTTPDFKHQWSLPAAGQFDGWTRGVIGDLAVFATVAEGAANSVLGGGADISLPLHGTLQVDSTAGTAAWQWAQDTSDGGNTSVRFGSWMHVRRIL